MKKLSVSVIAAAMLGAIPALAADLPAMRPLAPLPPPSPWDIAFGGALMTDYNFRGISQSNRASSATAYAETRYNVNANWQLYAGSQYWAVSLPTRPSCECDFYGGIRPTFGSLAFDIGYIYYYYPKERQQFTNVPATFVSNVLPSGGTILTLSNTDYQEVYGKVTWEVVKDTFSLGANIFYSPSWLNTGASGLYASGTAKWVGPAFRLNLGPITDVGWYVSGEGGHYSFGTADKFQPFFAPFALPDYWTWNIGLAFTYKVFTLDVRYYDTDLSKSECFVLTGDPTSVGAGTSKWCGSAVIGKFSADLTAMTNLK
jgi:uncharacterized protein (TIGR02001 family)